MQIVLQIQNIDNSASTCAGLVFAASNGDNHEFNLYSEL